MNWEAAELYGQAYYAEKGFHILTPQVRLADYDFVAEKDGKFLRVNVKVAGLHHGSWQISSARTLNRERQLDVILVWLSPVGRFLELPGSFLEGRKTRVIPRDLIFT